MQRVYLGIKFHPDHRNRDLVDSVAGAFETVDIETFCVARDLERWGDVSFSPTDLMRLSLEALEECDAVVIELSEKGVGLGIEAGYANAKGIPLFVLHPTDSDVSTTLAGIADGVFEYEDEATLGESVAEVAATLRT